MASAASNTVIHFKSNPVSFPFSHLAVTIHLESAVGTEPSEAKNNLIIDIVRMIILARVSIARIGLLCRQERPLSVTGVSHRFSTCNLCKCSEISCRPLSPNCQHNQKKRKRKIRRLNSIHFSCSSFVVFERHRSISTSIQKRDQVALNLPHKSDIDLDAVTGRHQSQSSPNSN